MREPRTLLRECEKRRLASYALQSLIPVAMSSCTSTESLTGTTSVSCTISRPSSRPSLTLVSSDQSDRYALGSNLPRGQLLICQAAKVDEQGRSIETDEEKRERLLSMKSAVGPRQPADLCVANILQNLYCAAELAQIIIQNRAKSNGWTVTTFPREIRLPKDIFRNPRDLQEAHDVSLGCPHSQRSPAGQG